MISNLKSDNIKFPLTKIRLKTGEIGYFAILTDFSAKKGVKCFPIWILNPNLELAHQGESFWPQNADWRLYSWPHRNLKAWVWCARHRAGPFLKKWYHWIRNASENHISSDPFNFLKKVEVRDTQVHAIGVFVNIAAPTRHIKRGFSARAWPSVGQFNFRRSEPQQPQSFSGSDSGSGSGKIMWLRLAPAPASAPSPAPAPAPHPWFWGINMKLIGVNNSTSTYKTCLYLIIFIWVTWGQVNSATWPL